MEDAYHSLSIEGFQVTEQLIERVRAGDWDPDDQESDRQNRDALAARGYWQAHRIVLESVSRVLQGGNPGAIVKDAHQEWYRAMFQPLVTAGLIRPGDLAGYRNTAVFLRSSRHVPPRSELVPAAMDSLCELLEAEPEPSVRAVLGHWLLGYIHPYPDGNGRLARFLMNVMLASGGYPWMIIRIEGRSNYMSALEVASTENDIGPFTTFIAGCMTRSGD